MLIACAAIGVDRTVRATGPTIKALLVGLSLSIGLAVSATAHAQDTTSGASKSYLRVEGGTADLAYNTLQYPENSDGTRITLRSLLHTRDKAFARVTYEYALDDAHGLRFVYAPLRDTGIGELPETLRYRGKTFAAGTPTHAVYQFNGYRATYWWKLRDDARFYARTGVTLNVRDAQIDLSQVGAADRFSNVGLVPLLYLALDYRLTPGLKISAEADAFAISDGRAVDANVRLVHPLASRIDALLGLRTLEGGADGKNDLYTYVRYNYATIGIGIKL